MSASTLKCPKCGAQVSMEKAICDYCGTYYVIEDKAAYTLESRPAIDENLKKWFDNMDMERKHRAEASIHQPPSDEKIRTTQEYVFMARNNLKKELGRIPTIAEVDERAAKYLMSYVHRSALRLEGDVS